jgi:hypothetical protein
MACAGAGRRSELQPLLTRSHLTQNLALVSRNLVAPYAVAFRGAARAGQQNPVAGRRAAELIEATVAARFRDRHA